MFIGGSGRIKEGQSGSAWYPGLQASLTEPGVLGFFRHALLPRWGDGAGRWWPLGGRVGGSDIRRRLWILEDEAQLK